ncbi:VENN motif pre-toxin domain-containing protein [Raoultella planticola]
MAELQGKSTIAATADVATAAIGTSVIAKAIDGPDDSSKLSKIQKQTVSSISTLTSGLAGGDTRLFIKAHCFSASSSGIDGMYPLPSARTAGSRTPPPIPWTPW